MLFWNNVSRAAGAVLLMAGFAYAEALPLPAGKVILTVSGNISNTNVGDTAQFDQTMLADLGQATIKTRTPWYDGEVVFMGTPLSALLKAVGADGEALKAVALNDYETDIPILDAWETDVILATSLNGEIMTVRDKGPIFIIYPYSSDARFQTQTYYARSAWQVAMLIVR